MHLEGRRGAMSCKAWWVITLPDRLLCWFYPTFLKLRHFSTCIHPSLCDGADGETELEWESIYFLSDMLIERLRKATYPTVFPVSLHWSYCKANSSRLGSGAVMCLCLDALFSSTNIPTVLTPRGAAPIVQQCLHLYLSALLIWLLSDFLLTPWPPHCHVTQ